MTPASMHRWRQMFWVATAWNAVVGLAITLFPSLSYRLAYLHSPNPGTLQLWWDFGLSVLVIGYGYFIVAQDPTKNRGIVWLGIYAKLFVDVFGITSRYLSGEATGFALFFAVGDGLFVVLFLWFLACHRPDERAPLAFEPVPLIADRLVGGLMRGTRRLEPFYRDRFDDLLRGPLEALVQGMKRGWARIGRGTSPSALAEETPHPEEEALTKSIAETMSAFLVQEYQATNRVAERAGNTKTYGLVRGTFSVHEGLDERLRVGLFSEPRSYQTYVRFAGPGPKVSADIDNNGILSLGVKLMGVPGQKLLDDELATVDLLAISCPTFTTPDVRANLKLQREIARGTPAWYFLDPFEPHLLDAAMQGLYARAHANPLELRYFSCVPYLFGEGRAVKLAFTPQSSVRSRLTSITPNYLQEAMARTLAADGVSFDVGVQFQTDPARMPIEDASIAWRESESPFVSVATLHIPSQTFDHDGQWVFARQLTFNPWHTIADHRPLGNQNRARRAIYYQTSRKRQAINGEAHVEPTGSERFD